MIKSLSKLILRLCSWKITGILSPDIKKFVLIVAPHTSNWDFIIGRLALFVIGIKAKFLIKKELFKFPLGIILKSLGGIPVERRKASGVVNQAVNIFHKYDSLILVITPEGTRNYNNKWKKGFYFIAEQANLPIAVAYLDYLKKQGGIDHFFYPTGNFKKDFKYIEDFYKDKTAKHPRKFNLSPIYKTKE